MTNSHAAAQLVAASPAAAAQQSITKEQALESLSEVGLWLSRDPHALRLRQFIEQASPAAAAAAGVPTGWKLVPREPTPLMVQVAREAESMMLSGPDIYRAMVLASPVAPVGAPTEKDIEILAAEHLRAETGADSIGRTCAWVTGVQGFARALLSYLGAPQSSVPSAAPRSLLCAIEGSEPPRSIEAAPSAERPAQVAAQLRDLARRQSERGNHSLAEMLGEAANLLSPTYICHG